MSFKLSSEARNYFREIDENSTHGSFDTLWDQYYLSAMAGIKARSRVPDDEAPSNDPFMDSVIQDYEEHKYELYSSLIVAEIDREGIPWEAEDEIRELMLNILDSTSNTRLTEDGAHILNCYAEKGFRIIRSEIPAPPGIGQFLKKYYEVLDDIDGSSPY